MPRKMSQSEMDEEREANQFAMLLLVPTKMLIWEVGKKPFDVEDPGRVRALARKFQVSTQVMTIRLVQTGLLPLS